MEGEEARHIILSRRMRPGEVFTLQDPARQRMQVQLLAATKNSLEAKILASVPIPPEPRVKISIFQSAVNEKAFEFILQKSTELGVSRIVVFNSKNTALKISASLFEKKLERWNKILWEAAKQCDRGSVPELEFRDNVGEVTRLAKSLDMVLVADVAGGSFQSALSHSSSEYAAVGLVVGPEGGFHIEEVESFKVLSNHALVSLGPFVLRSETAALAGAAVLRQLLV